jgi:hypothetical protein
MLERVTITPPGRPIRVCKANATSVLSWLPKTTNMFFLLVGHAAGERSSQGNVER